MLEEYTTIHPAFTNKNQSPGTKNHYFASDTLPSMDVAPLKRVPEAADDRGAVRAGDGLPLGAADVMQDVVASLHRHLHPGGSLGGVQRPGGGRQVLDVHVVFP